MNRRHRAAQLAGRASVQLHTLILFADNAQEEDAYVLDVETAEKSEPSIRVMVPQYGIEGQVKLPISSNDIRLTRLSKENKIVYDEKISIQVFDKVRVKVWVKEAQAHQRELVIDLLQPSFLPESSNKRKRI